MANLRYFHMSAATLAVAEAPCRARHTEERPGCALSITPNAAGTEFLVKVQGADKPWRQAQAWMGAVLTTFDRDNHGEALAMLATPEWSPS